MIGIPGGPEIAVIVVVALLVFGPKRLPEIARLLGKVSRAIRQATQEVKEQIDLAALETPPPRRPPKTISYEDSSNKTEESEPTPPTAPAISSSGEDDYYASTYEDEIYSEQAKPDATYEETFCNDDTHPFDESPPSANKSDSSAQSSEQTIETDTPSEEDSNRNYTSEGYLSGELASQSENAEEEAQQVKKPTPTNTNLSDDYVTD